MAKVIITQPLHKDGMAVLNAAGLETAVSNGGTPAEYLPYVKDADALIIRIGIIKGSSPQLPRKALYISRLPDKAQVIRQLAHDGHIHATPQIWDYSGRFPRIKGRKGCKETDRCGLLKILFHSRGKIPKLPYIPGDFRSYQRFVL